MPKLSIIIPCFNCAATLREAVESCYHQGFSPTEFEIILVDDCSTDTTRTVMETLSKEFKNITLDYHFRNQGGGATRNTATNAAQAEIIFCLDSDDLLPVNTLKKMYSFLLEKNADGVGVARSKKFIGTDITNISYVTEFSCTFEPIVLEDLLQRDEKWCSLYSVFMYTKAAFVKTYGYPTAHGFDTQGFAWRFIAAGLNAYTCPDTEYLHRVHHTHSYYLREFDAGKANVNWQYILLEHAHLFTTETQGLIQCYDVSNFTRSLFDKIRVRDNIFVTPLERHYGTSTILPIIPPYSLIARNSLRGIELRVIARIRKFFIDDSRVRRFIVALIVIKNDVSGRIHTPNPTRLILAYFGLRLRKLIKVGFYVPSLISNEPFDIVIPTVGKDFKLMDTYLEHLYKNLRGTIGSIYIVSIGSDMNLRNYCDNRGFIFIDEKSVLGYDKEALTYHANGFDRRGWLFQQLLKLSGDTFVKNSHYVIIDSDTLISAPYSFRDQSKYILYESTEWHPPYFMAFKQLFGYSAPHHLSLTSHMMIFSVKKLQQMKAEITNLHNMSWDKAYIACCDTRNVSGISDYDTYGQWLLKKYPHEVLTRPLYNRAFNRSKLEQLKDIEKNHKDQLTSISFHSYT